MPPGFCACLFLQFHSFSLLLWQKRCRRHGGVIARDAGELPPSHPCAGGGSPLLVTQCLPTAPGLGAEPPPAPPSNLCLAPSIRFTASPWREENVRSLIAQLRISQSQWMIKYHKTVCRTAEEKKIQTHTDTSPTGTEKRAMWKQLQALETSTTLVWL